jgi:glycosyltransferase involved in cell wall biosynthesis
LGQPIVTIVTPSYNQGEFIRATIESVLAQDYPYIEYIVMDGGSTDQTAAIASEYSSRLTWISERDRGQAHAINKGFQRAKGEIVAWLNSDDVLLPGAVSGAVKAFANASSIAGAGIGAIYGEGYLMDRDGHFVRRFPATEPFNLWKLTYLSDYVLQQSTFFRRAAVEEVGWLDEDLHYALDWDLLIKLGKRFGLHYVPDYFGALREYGEAKSFAGGRARIEEIRRVLERHTGLRRAPGYWTYGLANVYESWKQRFEQPRLGWLRVPGIIAGFGIRVAVAIPVILVLRHLQGLYPDRWASDHLKWMLPECTGPEAAGEVVVRGGVPEHPRLAGQVLAVYAGGHELGRWPAGPGNFELRFQRPKGGQGPFEFEIRAARYKRPRIGSEFSVRRMAWVVDTIEWARS